MEKFNYDSIPDDMKAYWHFVCWKAEPSKDDPTKIDKIPYNANTANTGYKASVNDPATWADFDTAVSAYQNGSNYDGIGFILAKDDPFTFIDFDKCINDDIINAEAKRYLDMFDSWTEYSQSGKGLHVLVIGNKPEWSKNREGHYEIYSTGRFCALTGKAYNPAPITSRQEVINQFCDEKLRKDPVRSALLPTRSQIRLTDNEIIELCRKANNSDKFNRLFAGDCGAYESQSEADLALCGILAFYTQEAGQILSIVRQSGLYDDKWERGDYQKRTIEKVLSDVTETYQKGKLSGNYPKVDDTEKQQSKSKTKKKKEESQATRLIKLCQNSGVKLWHTKDRQAYATFKTDEHFENWKIRSPEFKQYLQRLYYQKCKSSVYSQALQDACGHIEALAMFNNDVREVYLRLAQHKEKVYFDMCDDQWRAIEIDSEGWRIIDQAPVAFRRGRGMLALPEPVPGKLESLFNIFTVNAETMVLIEGWLIGALNPTGPYTILCVTGEQGSGKTMLCRMIRSILDPSKALLKSPPRDEHDLIITANNCHCLAYDNISFVGDWLSDALCRISSGGGYSTRQLYSDDEESIFDLRCPVLLNGIESIGSRGDFLDRTISISLPLLKHRRDEVKLWSQFDQDRGRILGGLLDCVSMAIKNRDIKIDNLPRMADFAKWVIAAEPSLGGLQKGWFMKAYSENKQAHNDIVLGSSQVAQGLIEFMQDKTTWEGMPKDLLYELELIVSRDRRKKNFPKDAIRLSGAIKRNAQALRSVGIRFMDLGRNERGALWLIEKS